MPERLDMALAALTEVVARLETAAASARAADAARLADLLAANTEVGARLTATASALRALSREAASRPDGPE